MVTKADEKKIKEAISGEEVEEIIEGMEDNLCRCGAHIRIIKAIQSAGQEMKKGILT